MTVERLRAAHDIAAFTCGNDDLDGWLHNSALTADRSGTARVLVHVDDVAVLGYFAIVPHTVRRADIPRPIGRGAPDTIPGFLLARLALAEHLHGAGRGGELLVLALTRILDSIAVGGGRLIVVDAIDDNAATFYQHFGFTPVPGDPSRLVIKASTAAASLGIDWP
jgi:GNAT superfamily N-acetyltransferase